MASISSISTQQSGVEQLVSKYLSLERKPIDELEKSKSSLSKKINIYSDLKSKLKVLSDRVKRFTEIGGKIKIGAKNASSSNEKVFTAEASSGASIGVNTIFVSRLASRDTAISKQFGSLNGTSLASKLYGTVQKFDITVGSNDAVRITLEFNDENETNESMLKRIVSAVNNSEADVSANYIKDTPDTARITIISNNTGSTNKISLQEVDGSNILRKLGVITAKDSRPQFEDTSGGFLQPDSDNLNASFTMNGISIIKDSNTVSDVLQGVTINLLSVQAGGENPETLSITHDGEAIKGEIELFIKDYNDIIKYLNAKTSVDPSTFTRGALVGKFTYFNLRLNLRSIISGQVSSVESGAPSLLSQIGIDIERNGTIKISDNDKFQEYIDKGDSSISGLFISENGIAERIDALLKNYVRTGGIVDDDKKFLTRRIKNIDKRIADFEGRLRIRESSLRRQFTDLQRMLSALNSQQAMIQRSMFNYAGGSGMNYGNQYLY